jgi:hypothetical protein
MLRLRRQWGGYAHQELPLAPDYLHDLILVLLLEILFDYSDLTCVIGLP